MGKGEFGIVELREEVIDEVLHFSLHGGAPHRLAFQSTNCKLAENSCLNRLYSVVGDRPGISEFFCTSEVARLGVV